MPFDNTNISVRSDLVTLLTCALDMIRFEEKWCRGEAHTADGQSHCAAGALWMAGQQLGLTGTVYDRAGWVLARLVEKRTGSDLFGVARYNDHFARHCDVVSLFQDAIAVAEREV